MDRDHSPVGAIPTADQFLRLCESLPLAVFETEANDRCVYVTPRWSEIRGQIDDRVDGHEWRDAINPRDSEWVLEEVQFARGQMRMFDADFRVKRPDGSIHWVHGRSLPLHQPDGTHDGFIHVIYDITDRKLIEERLRGSLEEMKHQGDLQAEQIRDTIAQLRDLFDEVSELACELDQGVARPPERMRKRDHSLDDILF